VRTGQVIDQNVEVHDGTPAQQPRPEPGQIPRISTVEHDLADPADRAIVVSAHRP